MGWRVIQEEGRRCPALEMLIFVKLSMTSDQAGLMLLFLDVVVDHPHLHLPTRMDRMPENHTLPQVMRAEEGRRRREDEMIWVPRVKEGR